MTTVDQLREKALAGQKVTADQLAKARADEDLAALQIEAEQARAEREAEAQRQADIAALARDCEEFNSRGLAAIAATYRTYVEAGRNLQRQLVEHNEVRRALRLRARDLDAIDQVDCGRELPVAMIVSRANELIRLPSNPIQDPALPVERP